MTIEILGDKRAEFMLVSMGRRAADVGPALESSVADLLRNIAGATFDSQGRRGGGSWARLKPATLRRKARMGQDPRIEHATGALRNSLTKDAVIDTTRNSLSFGSNLPYAHAQSAGDPSHNLPARPLIKLTPYDRRRISGILLDYIVTGAA
jgi:phage gpG-like protein